MIKRQKNELIELNAFNILFTTAILIVVVLFTALTVDLSKLTNADFWTLNLIKVGGLIVLFNWFRVAGVKIAKRKKKSYKKANIIHSKMCDVVKSSQLRGKVEERVNKFNKNALKEAQETLLEKFTNIITLDEILKWNKRDLKQKCKEIGYGWFHAWKLIRLAKRLKKGIVKYDKYTVHQVLHNPSSNHVNQSISEKEEGKILLYENLYISLRYLMFGAFLMLINWDGDLKSILIGIVVNLTLALSASFSGSKSADDYVGRCTDRLNNKNDLLAEVEGINFAQIEQEANMLITKEFYRNET